LEEVAIEKPLEPEVNAEENPIDIKAE